MTERDRLDAAWAEIDAALRADPPRRSFIARCVHAVTAYFRRTR